MIPAMTACDDDVSKGLDFLLSHLEEPIFPRDIMTKKLGYKLEVLDKGAVLQHYRESDYQDCRISAYPRFINYNGINMTKPSFIMIDYDLKDFDCQKESLDAVLGATLKRIYDILKVRPTVLWTGNGYHVYLPINSFVLEEVDVFERFVDHTDHDLSTKFMRFAEDLFTGNKQDSQHRPSINSCLLRVPYTFNSRCNEKTRVSIVHEWDGIRPAIQYMLRDFRRYLIQEKLDKINQQQKSHPKNRVSEFVKLGDTKEIHWIERLLEMPLPDYRKTVIWLILSRYLINVKRLSHQQSFEIINKWLAICDRVCTHNPRNFNMLTKANLKQAAKDGKYPIGLKRLKSENAELYTLLLQQNIVKEI